MRPDVSILVLGPLEVERSSKRISIPGVKARAVLAGLVLAVNHAIPADALTDAVWFESVADDHTAALQAHVARLRRILGKDAIQSEEHSYRLVAFCEQIDACRFERLVQRAEGLVGERPSEAAALCRQGLDLWRGRPYGELADVDPFRLEAIRLEELRQATVEVLLEAELAVGAGCRTLAMMQAAVAENPYRERLWVLLVQALWRTGRRAEALQAFDRYREVLEPVGLSPSKALEELRERIVQGEVAAVL